MNKKSEIDVCVNYIDYCSECSYLSNELKCEKCMEDYFLNKDGKCEHCYINKNIGLGCISCTDNEELKKNAPCQKCNGKNYFLTKENTCIFCKSEKYGGLFCEKCGYTKINNEETIGCIKCSYGYELIDGKCHDLYVYVSYCQEYGALLNKNNEKEYGCIKCQENYYLDENNECKTNKCNSGFQKIEGSCVKIYPDSKDKIIEGCLSYEYKYNYYYCIECDLNYILNKGYCLKKLDNPFLTQCSKFDYSSAFLKCIECNSGYNSYKLNSFLFCGNKYYGKCMELENIGTDLNPIYSCKSCSYTTILYENGVKICNYSNILDDRCVEIAINTNYYTDINIYTKCKLLYILSYSNYYEKNICKYIYEDEKTNNISISKYDLDIGIQLTNGKCNDGYFTRNGKVCIKCDDSLNGMPGCGGKCSFKINRENQLQCEVGGWEEGYFETLPGICKLCNETISGCESCGYIPNDKRIIFKPERKRKLICNKCNDKLFLLDGVCKTCYDINSGCNKCHEENNLFKCDEASINFGYYIDEDLREDYKMDSISEGNYEDKGNLKEFNLDGLVKKVDDITKDNSVFGRNELNKYILFIIDDDSKQIQGESIENFNFTISGITNKPMANNLLGQLTFLNTDDKKASCEIDAKDKNNAFMKCDIDAKEINFTNKQISIKEQEIEGQVNNIYFDGLNDVLFIGIEPGNENQKKSKKNIVLIIVLVLASAVFISLVVSISLFFYQKKHIQNTTKNIVDLNTYNNKNTLENNANPQTTENLVQGKKKEKRKRKRKRVL